MRRANRRLLALLALGGAALAPALAQQAPESILPPGFGEPAAPAAAGNETQASDPLLAGNETAEIAASEEGDAGANDTVPQSVPVDLPPAALRPTGQVGVFGEADGGLPPDAFGRSNGVFLTTVLARIEGPTASRWANILLRRALASATTTPEGVADADWVAERALVLARLGNADDARALVSRVDAPNYSTRLYDAAMQAALASADPALLCGLAAGANSRMPSWTLAQAMCAALGGDAGTASAIFDEVRRTGRAGGIDVQLAEKVAGAAGGARRATTVQWNNVGQLNAWRFGLATATGVRIPDKLYGTVGPQLQAWFARAPLFPANTRLVAGDRAAAIGVYSNAALVDLYGQALDNLDADERDGSAPQVLREAYTGAGERKLAALEALWGGGPADPYARYGRLVLTARAAALLPVPNGASGAQLDQLIAAMLSAGLDRQAAGWLGAVKDGSPAWAMLAVGLPDRPAVTSSAAQGFGDGPRRALFVAALAGLGRLQGDAAANLTGATPTPWSQALDRAVQGRERGTVALLVAAGLQTPGWQGVPPEHLFRIVRALREVGFEPEARMIAAEAITRT